ncbi:MAG TPA: gamma-glutamyltransferase [Kofleriaceae bacterium]
MRFAALVAVFGLVACHREPPPPATAPPNAEDPIKAKDVALGVTTGSGSGSGSATGSGSGSASMVSGTAAYGTEDSLGKVEIDPTVTGTGKTYLLVSESVDATKVGKQVLASGGNAVDAAVATAFALAVAHPTAGNLAGGGFAVVRLAAGKATALDFRETAPASATKDMYLDEKGEVTKDSLYGWRASGTPGSVAGLWALHEKLGKKPWKELVQPAIDLARNGYVLDKHTSESLELQKERLAKNDATKAIYFVGDKPHALGDTIKNEELAVALERIRDKGADGFYKGPTAVAIATAMKDHHGTITAADLSGYKTVWRDPIRFGYRGRSIVSMPLPSSGGFVLAMIAGMLKDRPLASVAWHGAEHVHLVTEAWRRGYAARNTELGDPAFVKDMPLEKLVSQDYLDKLAGTITAKASKSAETPSIIEGDHTTNLCVVDAQGMAVAMTTTLNTSWGSGVTINGFLMNNEMDDFTAKPGTPNAFGLVQGVANKIEPGKRMLSSMSPTFVEDDKGNLVIVVGAQGGSRIITAVWQVLSNIIDYNKSVAEAVALPRFHHQHMPDKVMIEDHSISEKTGTTLLGEGYPLDWPKRGFAAVNAIVRTPNGWSASADPREGGAAMGDD